MRLDQLLLPGLNREITLSKGDLFLPGIAILGDQVAGIPGEFDILDLPGTPLGNRDRFADVNKMI